MKWPSANAPATRQRLGGAKMNALPSGLSRERYKTERRHYDSAWHGRPQRTR
jgi:hypothetical protein